MILQSQDVGKNKTKLLLTNYVHVALFVIAYCYVASILVIVILLLTVTIMTNLSGENHALSYIICVRSHEYEM